MLKIHSFAQTIKNFEFFDEDFTKNPRQEIQNYLKYLIKLSFKIFLIFSFVFWNFNKIVNTSYSLLNLSIDIMLLLLYQAD